VPDLIKQISLLTAQERSHQNKADFEIDVEQPGTNGFNLLHVACGSGHTEICKFLLQVK
jgi:hypothetical protein